ncbi:aminoglycoside 6-adenylyltransferase [Pseudalkalibacillus sp. Hm43]|uniref:aminoglycoside 6-adenylyltransferase n=1 Tax=Pseudalkalibacillus sp. Hm43 TaxID=3450742 RepID=UPI003F42CA05
MGLEFNLTVKRHQLIERIEADLLADTNVTGVFYGGSIGAGNADPYSDIDLRIVVSESAFSPYIEDKMERAKAWGDVLFYEQAYPELSYTVVHYRSFVKVDCFYYRMEDLKPSIWLKKIRIVKDATGTLEKIQLLSQGLSYQPTIQEFDAWKGKLFAYFHEVYRRIMREELSYAQTMILGLKWLIAAGWYMEKGIQPNAFGDWSKMEGSRSPLNQAQQEMLQAWNLPQEQQQFLPVLNEMIPAANQTYKNLCNKLNVEEQQSQFDEVVNLFR